MKQKANRTHTLYVWMGIFYTTCLTLCCKNSAFLEKVPDASLILPETISDYQAIMDASVVAGGNTQEGLAPTLGETGTDDFYCLSFLNTGSWESLKKLYVWNDDIYNVDFFDWKYAYRAIYYCNIVLDGIQGNEFPGHSDEDKNYLRGQALFHRAHLFYLLSQVFSPPYDSADPMPGLGIPLRKSADINERLSRSSIHETYEQIITDLNEARRYLYVREPISTRPNKAAVSALLSRVFLIMGDYDQALTKASECLEDYKSLVNYNVLDGNKSYPINRYNPEVLLDCKQVVFPYSSLFLASRFRIDSNLYNSYSEYDLRRSIYFRKETAGYSYKGSYTGDSYRFAGITTSEVFLTRSECYARKGMVREALDDLDTLLINRCKDGYYEPFSAASSSEALTLVLNERRKELVFRGLRWSDLRRLNKQGANISISRLFEGVNYQLPPNDPRYTFIIPPDVMGFNNDWQQNPR